MVAIPRPLDCDRVLEEPEVWMGEMPRTWSEVGQRVLVNLAGMFPPGYAHGKVVLCLPMVDSALEGDAPAREVLERFVATVDPWVSAQPSYWHCHAGLNRSGMVLAAWMHLHRGWRISEAIAALRERRSTMVLCNSTFERNLREWYGAADEQDFQPFTLEVYLRERQRRRERGKGSG